MLDEMNSEGICAVELNHKLSLKLLDKVRALDLLVVGWASEDMLPGIVCTLHGPISSMRCSR